jgi:peroxiredoxin Q/BCP
MVTLKPGDAAPLFSANDQHGNLVSLEALKGKKVVLYFYPKDDTPGCTAEACNLRDNHSELISQGYVVIGVSPDALKIY